MSKKHDKDPLEAAAELKRLSNLSDRAFGAEFPDSRGNYYSTYDLNAESETFMDGWRKGAAYAYANPKDEHTITCGCGRQYKIAHVPPASERPPKPAESAEDAADLYLKSIYGAHVERKHFGNATASRIDYLALAHAEGKAERDAEVEFMRASLKWNDHAAMVKQVMDLTAEVAEARADRDLAETNEMKWAAKMGEANAERDALKSQLTQAQADFAGLVEQLNKLHGVAESVINRFKGWIPWNTVHNSQAKTENAFTEDALKQIDALARVKGSS